VKVNDLLQLNRLWRKIYPYLASQIMEECQRDYGSVSELGPFSGGISLELARSYPRLAITIGDESAELLEHVETQIALSGLSDRITVKRTDLDHLNFDDAEFDLAILRGAFFFLQTRENLLGEVFRVLKPGGMAFVGGGYGKGTPKELIDEIADESRELNRRLGRKRISVVDLEGIVRKSGLANRCDIRKEGGLWITIKKEPVSGHKDMAPVKDIRGLSESLDIQSKEVVSLVGAGGKTTLMFALSRELTAYRKVVITTTTTKIFPPAPSDTSFVFLSRDEEEIVDYIIKNAIGKGHVTIASELLPDSGKLQGISPSLVSRLIELGPVNCVIVEADGASNRPLKAPNPEYEPVIPPCTTLVIPMVGIDALGCKLSEERAFRSEIVSKLTGVPLGGIITADTIARLILHPRGITRGSPVHARIIPFINKVDLAFDLSAARDLASRILAARHPRIDRVVLGQAQLHPPVAEVMYRE
jgi:probable selenium-dependent hydroxylase accessory protein YqeC